nr:MAG TPA: cell division control protein 31 [Caudoviricetes sp.]
MSIREKAFFIASEQCAKETRDKIKEEGVSKWQKS